MRVAAVWGLLLLLACTACSAGKRPPHKVSLTCGTRRISQQGLIEQHSYLQKQPAPPAPSANSRTALTSIPTYFHLFRDSATVGDVSNGELGNQIKQLNRLFNKHGFNFVLKGTTRTTSKLLHRAMIGDDGRRELPAKRKVHKGMWDTLNIYVTGNLVDTAYASPGEYVAGFARFPMDPETNGKTPNPTSPVLAIDGVTIAFEEMGRNSSGRMTTTIPHEVGHWLGLYHTFEGGCRYPGDGISDTPYEARPSYGCKVVDTCTKQYGKDPIHNLMDYSSDDCQTGFTNGQGERMRKVWNLYRNSKTRQAHKYYSDQVIYDRILKSSLNARKE